MDCTPVSNFCLPMCHCQISGNEYNLQSSLVESQIIDLQIPGEINSTNIVVEITLKTEMGNATVISSMCFVLTPRLHVNC